MMRPGDITESGLLSEGSDVRAWKRRVDIFYRSHVASESTVVDVTKLSLSVDQARELIECNGAVKAAVDEAVTTAVQRVEKKHRVQMDQRDIAMAKVTAVQIAARETPDTSVKDVWQVAQKARPKPKAPAVQESGSNRDATDRGVRDIPKIKSMQDVPHASAGIVAMQARQLRGMQLQIQFACKYISPSMQCRIPDTVKGDPTSFWKFLPALSKPFPLFKLSLEVRSRIYGFAIGGSHEIRCPLPPLLSVNKQIREEALPIFYESTIFYTGHLPVLPGERVQRLKRALDIITKWSHHATEGSIKSLRQFEMSLVFQNPADLCDVDVDINFRFCLDTGLTYSLDYAGADGAVLSPASLATLDKHVAHVEKLRKTVHLQGECIIMVLLSWPELWGEGLLRLSTE